MGMLIHCLGSDATISREVIQLKRNHRRIRSMEFPCLLLSAMADERWGWFWFSSSTSQSGKQRELFNSG